jgi:hypothetical protein
MVNSYQYDSNMESLRKKIFELLDGNGRPDPLLSPKIICKELGLPYKQYHNYVSKVKWEWKHNPKNERGSKCSNIHCFKAKLVLDKGFSDGVMDVLLDVMRKRAGGCWRDGANCVSCVGCIGQRWELSRAKNRFLIYRGRLGRVTWFRSGTVLLHVNKPGNLGRAKQLFADAFGGEGLVEDVNLVVRLADGICEKVGLKGLGLYQKGLHAAYCTNQRLPSLTINDFAKSHGITVKVGDRSHPNAVEIIAEFPAQTERLIEQTGRLVERLESKELENVELKAKLGRLMELLDSALGEQKPSKVEKQNLGSLEVPSYVT